MFGLRTPVAPVALAGIFGLAGHASASTESFLLLDVTQASQLQAQTSPDSSHMIQKGWVPVVSFAWQDSAPVQNQMAGAAQVIASKDPTHPAHSTVVITRVRDVSSPKIVDLVKTGRIVDKAVLDERKVGSGTQTSNLYRVTFNHVLVTDYSTSDGRRPTEKFTLHFTNVTVQHTTVNAQDAAGGFDNNVSNDWDTQI